MKLAILIPAFNEEKTLAGVIKTLPKKIPGVTKREVIVINDGSTDKTEEIAHKSGATVFSHWINRGLGGALATGFAYAKSQDFDCLVTFDGDGQHHPDDLLAVIKPIINKKADVVVGARKRKGMPWYRRFGNWGLNVVTWIFYWVWTNDSQSGLRAFNREAIQKIKILSNRMEVSSEFFNEIGRLQLKLKEVPIRSIYTNYSLTKGQKNINGFSILFKIIYRRLFVR